MLKQMKFFKKIPITTNLATDTTLTALKIKYLTLLIYSKKLPITQKLLKLKRKLLIMNELVVEDFAAKLKQAN